MAGRAAIEEEGGEGYFASISDLMVGVLFVFLLMLTVFALNFRDAEEDQLIERERYEQALRDLEDAREEATRQEEIARKEAENARMQQAENRSLRALLEEAVTQLEHDIERRQILRLGMLEVLEDSLSERGVKVSIDTRSGVLRLSGDLLFETGAGTFRPEAARTVRTLAEVLGDVLPCYADAAPTATCPEPVPILETVLVEGHTDRQPYRGLSPVASQARNDALSTLRALTVFETLRATEPGLETLRNGDGLPLLGVSGYGERRPLPDAMEANRQTYERNRRIDVRFVLTSRTSEELERLRDEIKSVLDAPG